MHLYEECSFECLKSSPHTLGTAGDPDSPVSKSATVTPPHTLTHKTRCLPLSFHISLSSTSSHHGTPRPPYNPQEVVPAIRVLAWTWRVGTLACLAYLFRQCDVEDAGLESLFGDEWRAYRRNVPYRLIPYFV
ncbi:hypothetical protein NUW54_g711 [Trametes sanguinea]|uniref:Uncharacterized protein n=1 Tax=Trametes sanguinea TaxID=158606 RepID=A0ACC1Q8F2_9APHY|nr:hypothetical protein NUW54_g711 [Trametes sanguinea]